MGISLGEGGAFQMDCSLFWFILCVWHCAQLPCSLWVMYCHCWDSIVQNNCVRGMCVSVQHAVCCCDHSWYLNSFVPPREDQRWCSHGDLGNTYRAVSLASCNKVMAVPLAGNAQENEQTIVTLQSGGKGSLSFQVYL